MFVLATLLYPCVLALLCLGAGLLVDRAGGSFLPGVLLPVLGAAALIGLSQLTTYIVFLAPATPYLLALFALAGFALGRRRVAALAAGGWRRSGWQLAVPLIAYLAALAPVLFAGRPSFSSYGVLTDSAFHMLGADFLIHHGQDYAHLDLRNSPGQYLNDYYNTYYPSGADTLFGGSALLLRVPLIWAFQPFNAFMLALWHRPGLGARATARPRRLARGAGDVDDHAAGARLWLRADRLRQGDLLAIADPRPRRARRAAPALAARPAPRGGPVRARHRRRGLGARGGVRRVGAHGGGRAGRDRGPRDCLRGHRSG